MLEVNIPGGPQLGLNHLILDYNGTIALDGDIIPGVMDILGQLADMLTVHVLTADTHGTVREKLPLDLVRVHVLSPQNQDQGKLQYTRELENSSCVCVGNGRNDALMLREAGLGIAVVQSEGCHFKTMAEADIIVPGILEALNLLLKPNRIIATWRN
jgi:soluble P-type ATPase